MILDLRDHADDLRGNLLVELHIALEFGDDRARERFDLDRVLDFARERGGLGLEKLRPVRVFADFGALDALDQHLDGVVGQLQELQHLRQRADLVDRILRRLVVTRAHLRRQQDVGVVPHHLFEGANGLLAADEKRHDHVRKYDDVPQRKHREGLARAGSERRTRFRGVHSTQPFFSARRSLLAERKRRVTGSVPGESLPESLSAH